MALAVLPVVLVAGCGGGDSKKSSSSTASGSSTGSSSSSAPALSKPVTNGNLADIKVDTSKKNAPVVSIPAGKVPFGTKDATTRVVSSGKGATIGDKDLVTMSHTVVNGTTGKTIFSSFGQTPATLNLGSTGNIPALANAIKGKKVGDTLLISVPGSQAFGGKDPDPSTGLTKNDDVIFYVSLTAALPSVTDCKTPASDPALPKVTMPKESGGQASMTFPKNTKAPTKLTCAVLKEGTGATVKAGQNVSFTYTGQIWNGSVFDSSKKSGGGKPASFPIGTGQLIPAWDMLIPGQKVGTRMLIVVPPAYGYGSSGNAQAGIKGTDTLAFVVDIASAK